jgi:hypothetical protein
MLSCRFLIDQRVQCFKAYLTLVNRRLYLVKSQARPSAGRRMVTQLVCKAWSKADDDVLTADDGS